jgi:hypothetical protein
MFGGLVNGDAGYICVEDFVVHEAEVESHSLSIEQKKHWKGHFSLFLEP